MRNWATRVFVGISLLISGQVHAQAGDYLYRVQTVRAAPGGLQELIESYQQLGADGYFAEGVIRKPFVLRHSQGDQWDLMLLWPMRSAVSYYAESAADARTRLNDRHAEVLARIDQVAAFSEDHFMTGLSLEKLMAEFSGNDFAHIEVFHAVAGKRQALVHQRVIENQYLEGVERKANVIFVTQAGGDADVMTIGLYPSLQVFAAPQTVAEAQRDSVAKRVGFKGLDDISYYLRSLISAHHDTLASVVDIPVVVSETP